MLLCCVKMATELQHCIIWKNSEVAPSFHSTNLNIMMSRMVRDGTDSFVDAPLLQPEIFLMQLQQQFDTKLEKCKQEKNVRSSGHRCEDLKVHAQD